MKTSARQCAISAALALSVVLLPVSPRPILAQYQSGPFPGLLAPTTPDAQRNAMNTVQGQVSWLQNATQTASAFNPDPVGSVWRQFQLLRSAYNSFTMTLSPQQAADGANDLAELSAGLNILQEAFTNYQDDIAVGRSAAIALQDMCQVLNQAAGVWLPEFNQDCAGLQVGW